jgi:hypothetical protein
MPPRRVNQRYGVYHTQESGVKDANHLPLVDLPWLEQGTSVLSGLRSNQLSYRSEPRNDASKANN